MTKQFIHKKFVEMQNSGLLDRGYLELYKDLHDDEFALVLSSLHYQFNDLIGTLKSRINGKNFYFKAGDSRALLKCIEIEESLERNLSNSPFKIKIDETYKKFFSEVKVYLRNSNGSLFPEDFYVIDIDEVMPIFYQPNFIIKAVNRSSTVQPILIGEGSYACVHYYEDPDLNKKIVIKKAKEELNNEELLRFKNEFDTLKSLSSPYIVEVYKYDGENHSYTMEYMDAALQKYITLNNQKINPIERISIAKQIFAAFKYIHSKGLLHRDICPNNILINKYDDGKIVVKVSDFGLVKIPNSTLTTVNTAIKGSYNDIQGLEKVGFSNYSMCHETYALAWTIYFTTTGRKNIDSKKNDWLFDFVSKGTDPNPENRFKSVEEMEKMFDYSVKEYFTKGK